MGTKHLESQFVRTLIEMSSDPLVVTDTDGKIMDMNESFPNLTSKTRKQLTATKLADYFTTSQKASEVFQEIQTKGSVKNYPLTLQNKEGKLSDVLVNGSVCKDEKGNALGIVLLIKTQEAKHEHVIEKKEEQSAAIIRENKVMHNFFMQTPALMHILKGPEHIFGLANSEYQKFIGNRNPTGKKLIEAMPELKGQVFIEILDKVYNTGEPFSGNEMPVSLTMENGNLEQRFVNVNYIAVDDSEGQRDILAFAYDVTEQIVARKKIEASERRFSNILSQSLMAIGILKGPEMVISFANDPLLATWGKGGNIIGKPLLEVLPEIKDQGFPELLQKVYTTGVPFYGYEIKVNLIRNGKEEATYYNFVYQPYTEIDNSITGITILATDVTEQVLAKKQIDESVQQFQTLANSIPQLAWMMKADGSIYWYNQQWFDYTGTTLEQMQGNGWQSVYHPDVVEEVTAQLKNAITSGQPYEHTFLLRSKEGSYRWFLTRAVPVRNDKGEIEKWFGTNTDVTEAKATEQKIKTINTELELKNKFIEEQSAVLKKEHQLLHNYFEEAPAFFVILKGKEHIFEFANTMYHQLIGNRDILGKKMMEALPELKGQGFDVLVDEIHRTGKPFSGSEMPAFIEQEKGKLKQIYIDLHCQAIKSKEGHVDGIIILGYDVTELVLTRKKIEESEKRLSNILSQSVMSIAILKGTDMIINFANEMMMASWGKGKNIIDKPLLEVLPELEGQSFPKLIEKVFTTGVPYYGYEEKVTLVNNGKEEVAYYNYVYQPYTEIDNSITGVTVLASEVTAQVLVKKENEEIAERFRLLADAQPQKVWTADNQGNKNYFNQQWFDYTHLTFKELKDWGWKKIVHPDDWELNHKTWQHSIDTGTPYECEHRFLKHDGTYRWHISHAVAQKDNLGEIIMWVGSNADINDQKTATENLKTKVKEITYSLEYVEEIVAKRTNELADANSNLQKSNDELAQFAYIASHDMQEPLRKISSFTEMLEERIGKDLDDQSKTYFDKINTSSARMHNLIRDILSYSELVKKDEVFESVNLNQIVENLKLDYDLLLEQKGALIHFENLPVIEAIPVQMSQLFGNIIGNSLKFGRKDTKLIISISAFELSGEEKKNASLNPSLDYIKIQLKDNGIGLKEEYTTQIFKIFQRLHNKSDYQGTGIGLAMCKKIALNHHGDINAEGSSENGAVFNVFLPFYQINKLTQSKVEQLNVEL